VSSTVDGVEFPAGRRRKTPSVTTAAKSTMLLSSVPRRRIDKLQRENKSNLDALLRIQRETPYQLYKVNKKGETKAHIAARTGDIAAVAFLLDVEPSMFLIKDQNEMVPSQLASPRRNGLVSRCKDLLLFEQPFRFITSQQRHQ
jgi:ankyrin repeat protein